MDGGSVIPDAGRDAYDFDRLERAISALVESHRRLDEENESLRKSLDAQNRRIRALDAELLQSNQRRQDAIKRIDELIAHLDQLDAEFEQAAD